MNKTRALLIIVIAAAISAYLVFDLGTLFSLDNFVEKKQLITDYVDENFVLAAILYALLYVLVFAFALPVGAVLTLVGGAVFGLAWGTVLVSFASTIGSTMAFLAARYLLRDWVAQRFARRMQPIDQGIEKDGAFYLFTLRLVPVFPPALINLAMGVTSLKTWTFYWVSQLGMLAGTAVYVNAGTALGNLQPGEPILTSNLVIAFVLLGLFPLLAKRSLDFFKGRRIYAGYTKPKHFDTNMVVIGAGSGGLVSAYIAAQVKASVTLVERDKMGGDCLNTGCVPSKALLRSAKIAHYVSRAKEFGLNTGPVATDFAAVMDRVHRAIATIEPHDSVERYSELGVDCIQGEAVIVSPWEVQVGDKIITTQNIVIASGGRPRMVAIPGVEQIAAYNSDTIWGLGEQPQHLLVIGAGPIGCELAQAFARLGSRVTILTNDSNIMPREDADVSDVVLQQFLEEGIEFAFEHTMQRFESSAQGHVLVAEHHGQQRSIDFTHALFAVGRDANTQNMGLEALGIDLTEHGTIDVDEYLRTAYPNIYAVGDVAGPYQFTHMASHQAWYAAVNALFGRFKMFKVDYSIVPWATFTDPEVARVGLSETEAKAQAINFEVTQYSLDDLDRAIADGEARGFVKVITAKGNDKILGATIVGYHAGELLNEFIATMKRGGRLNDILSTIHIYPTLGEANKFVAGEWRKANKPEKLLAFVARFHRWTRS